MRLLSKPSALLALVSIALLITSGVAFGAAVDGPSAETTSAGTGDASTDGSDADEANETETAESADDVERIIESMLRLPDERDSAPEPTPTPTPTETETETESAESADDVERIIESMLRLPSDGDSTPEPTPTETETEPEPTVPTPTPTETETNTPTPTPTETETETETSTVTERETETETPTPTPTEIETETETPTPTETETETETPTETETDGLDWSLVERSIHQYVNDERTQRGLDPVAFDVELRDIARSHSEDMATRGYFSHTDPDGNGFSARYEEHGYDCRAPSGDRTYLTGGENIAQTWYDTPVRTDDGIIRHTSEEELARGITDQWMNSQGHRENILNEHWNNEGIGLYVTDDGKVFATQNFC